MIARFMSFYKPGVTVHAIVVTRRIALAQFYMLFLCIVILFLSVCLCLHVCVCAGLVFGVAIVSRH